MGAMQDVSLRERYLNALRGNASDELIWAPNFDYWLAVNSRRGTLPPKYEGMSRNDIVRSIGAAIWNRVSTVNRVLDKSVQETWRDVADGVRVHTYVTPLGAISEEYRRTEDEYSTMALTRHFIKSVADIAIMKYVVEATDYEANYEAAKRALVETGDDGVVLSSQMCVPFIQFAKTDAGYIEGVYLFADHESEVEQLVKAYTCKYLQMIKLQLASPVDIIACDDNMDELTVSPKLFRRFVLPYYQECKRLIKGTGKLFEAHWCGRTPHLLPLVPESGLDVVEAVVTEPMANITLTEALDALDGKVTMQGGIPAVMVCADITPQDKFEKYIERTILPLRGRKAFVLGMSDNVPPNADFSRVEAVAKLIAKGAVQ